MNQRIAGPGHRIAPSPARAATAASLVLAALVLTLTGRGHGTAASVRLLVALIAAAVGGWLVVVATRRTGQPVPAAPPSTLLIRVAVALPAAAFAAGASIEFTIRGLCAGVAAGVALLIIRRTSRIGARRCIGQPHRPPALQPADGSQAAAPLRASGPTDERAGCQSPSAAPPRSYVC